MKTLTVMQPWAWALVRGTKRIENRSWATSHRGPLLIHAGKGRQWMKSEAPKTWPGKYGIEFPELDALVFGALIGAVDVVDCVPFEDVSDNPWAFGPICWVVENPRPLANPLPWKGKLMLFDVADDVIAGQFVNDAKS